MTVERCKVTTQIAQIEASINAAQKMVCRYVCVEIESVEEMILRTCPLTHHRDPSFVVGLCLRLRSTALVQQSFSTK